MECEIDLAFKHPNPDYHRELADEFKKLGAGTITYSELISSVAKVCATEESDSISESTFQTLFDGCDVKANEKKISVGATTGGDFETTVPEFINFVLSFGGKPLACKVEMDESRITYKHTKSGISLTTKELWDE